MKLYCRIVRLVLVLALMAIKNSYACSDAWNWFCEISHGIMMAESQGQNGIVISGYAYHTSIQSHWPTGSADQTSGDPLGLNEFPYGLGYARSWYNSASHEEYTLFALGFADSYWKPEVHAGYIYQKFHQIYGSDHLEWGLGYSPQILIKPSWTNDAPLILPFIGLTTSLRYKDYEINATWANVVFVNAKIMFD